MLFAASAARAEGPTPGYPEAVIQWGVQKDETCDDVSKSVYGSADHVALIYRYNRVVCAGKLREGLTLVLPARVTNLPDAKLKSMNPDVQARPPGGGWTPAAPGLPLYSSYNVNTLEAGRADIEFIDRTRVFLAPNTLVVIYGTASSSKVAKAPAATMQVESGEIKLGLAALRGDSVDVDVTGGGRVSAASREAVVQKKGDRTTVGVYDGTAKVQSAGATVNVPTNFGTRFFKAKPPAPPRPLPDPPQWQGGALSRLVLTSSDLGTLSGAWDAVATATSYRVEVARDHGLRDYVVREEVPSTIRSLRAEKMPLGTYYVTVRAIDKEEYLGVAAKLLVAHVVHLELDGPGRTGEGFIEASPYGRLKLSVASELELALDDEATFGPVPKTLDLKKLAPKRLRFRDKDGAEQAIDVRYMPLTATIAVTRRGSDEGVEITFHGGDGLDLAKDVGPSLRLRHGDKVETVALQGSANGFTASLPTSLDARRLDLTDDKGRVLATSIVPPDAPADAPSPPLQEPRYPVIGPTAPLWPASRVNDVAAWSPTAQNQASASALLTGTSSAARFEARVRASGQIGPLGVDAAVASDTLESGRLGATAWLGVRVRALRLGLSELELAPTLRFGAPLNVAGGPARLEPGLALGGAQGRFTWLVDAAVRLRLADDKGASGAPPAFGYLILGGAYDVFTMTRASALLDGGASRLEGEATAFRGGLTLGVEVGKQVFGGAGLRLAPWRDEGASPVSGQLTLGLREQP